MVSDFTGTLDAYTKLCKDFFSAELEFRPIKGQQIKEDTGNGTKASQRNTLALLSYFYK